MAISNFNFNFNNYSSSLMGTFGTQSTGLGDLSSLLGGTSALSLSPWQQQMQFSQSMLGSLQNLQSLWSSLLGGQGFSSFGQGLSGFGQGFSGFGQQSLANQGFGQQGFGFNQGYGGQGYGNAVQNFPPPPPPPPQGNWNNQSSWGSGYGHQQCPPQPSQGWTNSTGYGTSATGNTSNVGTLSQGAAGEPMTYTTSGGWTISIDGHKTVFTDPSGEQNLEYSGDPHEYLNGEHIKDWETKQRTVELPDGTKVTLTATGALGLTTDTSIYDGNQNIQFDNTSNTVTSQSTNWQDTATREQAQYDGEYARLAYDGNGGLIYTNYFTQNEDMSVTSNYGDIASLKRNADGTYAVEDYYT